MKKALLASTALVGAALLSAPAQAGTVGSGDNLAVTLSGFMWFQASWLDEDNQSGYGRGHAFQIPETEIAIKAENTADNGIKYGVVMEIETNTDAAGGNGDEIYATLSGDFGTVQLGDQDSATNTMLVGAFQAHQGLAGPLGGLGALLPVFHAAYGAENLQYLTRTDFQNPTTSDSTKIIYFSPRFSGFQVGASYTPDTGARGASFTERDDNGSYENVIDLGANYTGKFDDFGISVSALYQHGDGEQNTATMGSTLGGTTKEDLDIWYIGAKVDFAGFTVGANYADFNESGLNTAQATAGQDAGDMWQVGVGYKQGPWGVSAWYSLGERAFGTNGSPSGTDETITRFGVGGRYAIAPGWQIRADYNYIEHENIGGSTAVRTSEPFTTNESQAFILTNMFNF